MRRGRFGVRREAEHRAPGRLLFSTFLGGSDWDDSRGIALGEAQSVIVGGFTGTAAPRRTGRRRRP
jgi:hypothetical protein